MALDMALIAVIVVSMIVIVIQRSKVVIARRQRLSLSREIAKEREATAAILTLSRDVITTDTSDDEFLSRFIEYAVRTLQGMGGAILRCDEDGYFNGCAIAGTFPPIKDVPPQVEQQLIAHAKKHTEYLRGLKGVFRDRDVEADLNEEGYALYCDEIPTWAPPRFGREAKRILIAPIVIKGKINGCVIVVSGAEFDSHIIEESDGVHLVRLTELASLSIEVLRVFRERQEYEENLQSAREEGMMQVSTGIIHNIGNAVTVAKLSVLELQEKIGQKKEERPETLITEELLPKLQEQVKKGKIGEFLSKDQAGSQYLDIMSELLGHIGTQTDESGKQLKSLSNKLLHISEIIELQQRFVGELGTENMTQLSGVIESAIMIFEETFNKGGVKIKTDIRPDVPEVLIDSSMMTQVYMNLIKNAVEAMESDDTEKDYTLEISLRNETEDGEEFALVTVKDNGPGIPKDIEEQIFAFGFSTKGKSNTRGYGLHSCLDTVKKYGGRIDVMTEIGKGTSFNVYLPVGRSE